MSAKFPRGGGGSKPILSHPSNKNKDILLNSFSGHYSTGIVVRADMYLNNHLLTIS